MRIVQLTTDARDAFKTYDRPKPYFGTAPQGLLNGFSDIPEIEVHVISCSRQPTKVPEKLASNIWFYQPLVRKWGWGRTLFSGCIKASRDLIRRINPDIVHGQGTERDCAMAAVCSGYPNILTIHGIMQAVARSHQAPALSYYGLVATLERFALRRSYGVLCNSAYTESQVAPYARQTWRVPNCIRPQFINHPLPVGPRAKILVVLGSIIHYKQSAAILELWASLADITGSAKLFFVGSASNDDYGRAFLQRLQQPDLVGRAEHINWLEIDDLIHLLDRASGMIHFPTEESFGLAVAEGLARNLKLFAARTGGVPDVIHGCEGVESFAADDWHGLAQALHRWIQEGMPTVHTSTLIAARFSPLAVARQHLGIYRRVLSR